MRQRPTFSGAGGPTEKPRPPPAASAAPPAHALSLSALGQHVQLVETMLCSTAGGGRFRTQTGATCWVRGLGMVADCCVFTASGGVLYAGCKRLMMLQASCVAFR
jgi:hypothetical protein